MSVWLPTLVRVLDTASVEVLVVDDPAYELVSWQEPERRRNREASTSRWMHGDTQTSSVYLTGDLVAVIRCKGATGLAMRAAVDALDAAAQQPGYVEATFDGGRQTWRVDEAVGFIRPTDAPELASFQQTVTVTWPAQPILTRDEV